LPDAPSRVVIGGASRYDSVFDGFADKKKVRADFIVALE
jgi:2-C-methyl-D-erythritol 4-phosphate cytidylyltransferase